MIITWNAAMFRRVSAPVLGSAENMTRLECSGCAAGAPLFGSGGGRGLADELGVPLLGEIPLYPPLRAGGDEGVPIVLTEPESAAARALEDAARRVVDAVDRARAA